MILVVLLCVTIVVTIVYLLLSHRSTQIASTKGNIGEQDEHYVNDTNRFGWSMSKKNCTNGLMLGQMNIYLINLDRNTDRLEHFIEQYMLSDMRYAQFKRFAAIDGKKVRLEEHVSNLALKEITDAERTGYRTKHYQLTRGAVGCYLSHMGVWKMAAESDKPYSLVFEDDVEIDSNILKKTNELLPMIPNDWDVLLLGCFCIVCDRYEKYYETERFFLTHSYIIKRDAAKNIYNHLKKKRIEQQIDSELSDMIGKGMIKIYCLREAICKQRGSFNTTIQMPLKMLPGVNPYQSVH
jgi:glycosyl transferase, family 25